MIYFKDAHGHVFRTENPEYHKDAEALTKADGMRLYKEQMRKQLAWIKPRMVIYTVLRKVSKSGMSREISLFAVKDGKIISLDGPVSVLLGYKLGDQGIKVSGCGMDMGFHTVYSLGLALWPNGTPEPHGTRNGTPDTCGGYALKHEWM